MAKALFHSIKSMLRFEMPAPRAILAPLYNTYRILHASLLTLTRVFFWTPLFKGRLQHFGSNLYLFGGLPFISGPVEISIGDDCRISGRTTISGRNCTEAVPQLIVGNNIDIGWMTSIAVGRRVEIGNNVRIAGRCFLAGYPGHPLNAEARAAGLPETDAQVGDIILEEDVWLATSVYVMAGVRIGKGTIVAAGSVVTHDLPAGVLAAGTPARIVRTLEDDNAATGSK